MTPITFKASYFYRLLSQDWNPFTPDIITIDDHMIEHKRRNWYLISSDSQSYHFQNLVGVDIDKGFLGADLIIRTTGSAKIIVTGFSKGTAESIKEHCRKQMIAHSHKGRADKQVSVADELHKLKSLLDGGALSQSEYDAQKAKVLS